MLSASSGQLRLRLGRVAPGAAYLEQRPGALERRRKHLAYRDIARAVESDDGSALVEAALRILYERKAFEEATGMKGEHHPEGHRPPHGGPRQGPPGHGPKRHDPPYTMTPSGGSLTALTTGSDPAWQVGS